MEGHLTQPTLADPSLLTRLGQFAETGREGGALLPWCDRLPEDERRRFQSDLATLLREPEETGEALDLRELLDLLEEFAELAGWDASPLPERETSFSRPPEDGFHVDLRPAEARELERAPLQIRNDLQLLLETFLPYFPTSGDRLPCGRIKKMSNRGIWQIQLAAGYRLRYFVDEPGGVVYVVYLGPHPEGHEDGREASVRAAVRRARHGGNPSPAGSW